jgi:hypothetical protein
VLIRSFKEQKLVGKEEAETSVSRPGCLYHRGRSRGGSAAVPDVLSRVSSVSAGCRMDVVEDDCVTAALTIQAAGTCET